MKKGIKGRRLCMNAVFNRYNEFIIIYFPSIIDFDYKFMYNLRAMLNLYKK